MQTRERINEDERKVYAHRAIMPKHTKTEFTACISAMPNSDCRRRTPIQLESTLLLGQLPKIAPAVLRSYIFHN
jgi:hypothetical protein